MRNVLVISSSSRLGGRLTTLLQAAGAKVRHATGEAAAAVALLAHPYDAVVIDRSLPEDGAACVLRRLCLPEYDHTAVVVVSDSPSLALGTWASTTVLRGRDLAASLRQVCEAIAV